jgi:hypothetical protein
MMLLPNIPDTPVLIAFGVDGRAADFDAHCGGRAAHHPVPPAAPLLP